MGSVKLETKNEGRGNHEWDMVSLNSVNAVYFFILKRSKYDEIYLSKNFYSRSIFNSNGVPMFIEAITCLYADLDNYIKKANLYKHERSLINKLMLGYDFIDLTSYIFEKHKLVYNECDLKKIFKHACRKILYEINYDYEIWTELQEYKKINKKVNYKECMVCKKILEINNLNFKKNLDKYLYRCRKCDSKLVYLSKIKKKFDYKR